MILTDFLSHKEGLYAKKMPGISIRQILSGMEETNIEPAKELGRIFKK